MKKFDKAVGSKYRRTDDEINFKTPSKSKPDVFYFYWKNKRIIKDGAYKGWSDLVTDILTTNGIDTTSYFDYSLRFMDRYNSLSGILKYPMKMYSNYGYVVCIHYDSDVIEDILKPSRVIIRWSNGFNHCINFCKENGSFEAYNQDNVEQYKKNGSFIELIDYASVRGDVFIEHGLTDQSDALKALLRTKFNDIPDEYKVGVTVDSMDYNSLFMLFEMSQI